MTAVILNLKSVELTDTQFYQLCQVNPDWQFERTAKGELVIMPPVGGISGKRVIRFNRFTLVVEPANKTR